MVQVMMDLQGMVSIYGKEYVYVYSSVCKYTVHVNVYVYIAILMSIFVSWIGSYSSSFNSFTSQLMFPQGSSPRWVWKHLKQ